MSTAASTIEFACESIRALWDELLPLLVAHHGDRRAESPSLPDLEVDIAQYEILDAAGRLRVFTARCEGKLVGYGAFVLASHLHCRSEVVAHHDVVYMAPSHRAALAGVELVLHAERALAAEGVGRIYQAAPPDSAVGRMFERLGYQAVEVTYTKRLGRQERSHG